MHVFLRIMYINLKQDLNHTSPNLFEENLKIKVQYNLFTIICIM